MLNHVKQVKFPFLDGWVITDHYFHHPKSWPVRLEATILWPGAIPASAAARPPQGSTRDPAPSRPNPWRCTVLDVNWIYHGLRENHVKHVYIYIYMYVKYVCMWNMYVCEICIWLFLSTQIAHHYLSVCFVQTVAIQIGTASFSPSDAVIDLHLMGRACPLERAAPKLHLDILWGILEDQKMCLDLDDFGYSCSCFMKPIIFYRDSHN